MHIRQVNLADIFKHSLVGLLTSGETIAMLALRLQCSEATFLGAWQSRPLHLTFALFMTFSDSKFAFQSGLSDDV